MVQRGCEPSEQLLVLGDPMEGGVREDQIERTAPAGELLDCAELEPQSGQTRFILLLLQHLRRSVDPDCLARYGRAGRAIVEREFSWAAAGDATVALYRELLG